MLPLLAAHADRPSSPCLTFYDQGGFRIEMSGITLDNWVCKIASYFADELDCDAGEAVAIHLPVSWHSIVLQLGALAAGLTLVDVTSPEVELIACAADQSAFYLDRYPHAEILAVSLDPLGRGATDCGIDIDEARDALAEIRVQPDAYSGTCEELARCVDTCTATMLSEKAMGKDAGVDTQSAHTDGCGDKRGDDVDTHPRWVLQGDATMLVLPLLALGHTVVLVPESADAETIAQSENARILPAH